MTRQRNAPPPVGTPAYMQRVVERAKEMLNERLDAMARQKERARKPTQREARTAFEQVAAITDPAEMLAAQQAFVQRYGAEEWAKQLRLALRRQEPEV